LAKSVALGFGAAGAVVAAAVIAVVGSTVGFGAEEIEERTEATSVLSGGFAPADTSLGSVTEAGNVVSSEVVTTDTGEQVEYVYVDAPAASGHDDDDDDDDDEHEEHEREEHEHEPEREPEDHD